MNIRRIKFSVLILTLLLSCASTVIAQFNDYKTKFGIQVNGLIPYTEFETNMEKRGATYEPSYTGRMFLRIEIVKNFIESELGAGYGQLLGQDLERELEPWKTTLLPIDVRLIVSPFKLKLFDINAYLGLGILRWKVTQKPVTKSPAPVEQSGWAAFIPVGVNIDIKLTDNKFIELSAGYSHTFTDNLNYYNNIDAYGEETSNDGYMQLGVGLVFVGGSGLGDNDLDSLTNREEKELGTDPANPDTDMDGLKDGEEVKNQKTNPLNSDTDGDGLTDGDEVLKFNTSPNKLDTDGDGLNDRDELNKYLTDPLITDSDKDSLNDSDETLKYLTDALHPDTDNDELSDGDEVTIYKTDPLKSDSDADSLTDSEEIKVYKTNPLSVDSDGEGLSDGDEIKLHKTNPLIADTDGGSVDDFVELERGTNPLNAEDDVIKINVPIVLEGITFKKNKADITPESAVILLEALKTMLIHSDISVLIGGHTDNVGNNITNLKLSQRRAESVKAWLVSKGIDQSRITAIGFGEETPRVPNDSEANKLLNRRIEFIRIK